MRARVVAVLAVLVLGPAAAGCVGGVDGPPAAAAPPPFVPPTSGDYPASSAAECPSVPTRSTLLRFRVAIDESRVEGPEHALAVVPNASAPLRPTLVFTWRHQDAGERPDYVTRANTFELHRDGRGDHHVCARVDLVAPDEETPPLERAWTLRVLATPQEDLPPGNYSAVANWVLGCFTCNATLRGNASASFALPTP